MTWVLGIIIGFFISLAFVKFLCWIDGLDENKRNPKYCDHEGKGGAKRWMSWNGFRFQPKEKVKRECGQCGKTITFTVVKNLTLNN